MQPCLAQSSATNAVQCADQARFTHQSRIGDHGRPLRRTRERDGTEPVPLDRQPSGHGLASRQLQSQLAGIPARSAFTPQHYRFWNSATIKAVTADSATIAPARAAPAKAERANARNVSARLPRFCSTSRAGRRRSMRSFRWTLVPPGRRVGTRIMPAPFPVLARPLAGATTHWPAGCGARQGISEGVGVRREKKPGQSHSPKGSDSAGQLRKTQTAASRRRARAEILGLVRAASDRGEGGG